MRRQNKLDKILQEEETKIAHENEKEVVSLKHAIYTKLLRCLNYCIIPFICFAVLLVSFIYIKNNTWESAYQHLKYVIGGIVTIIIDRYFSKR